MFSPIQIAPGTTKVPLETETSSLAYTDTNNVHFPDGRLRTVDPWADVTPSTIDLLGGGRSVFGHRSSSAYYYLFGTSTRLYAQKNGVMYNMTPLADQKHESLGSDPLDTTSSDATLTISWTAHGLSVGDYITLSGAADVGGVDADTYINVEHIVDTVPDANSITVEMGTTAGSTATGGGSAITAYAIGKTKTLGSNPLATFYDTAQITPIGTTDGSNEIAILTAGYDAVNVGDVLTISGIVGDGSTLNGIPLAEINTDHTISRISGTTLYANVQTAASSTGFPTEASSIIAAKLVEVSETAHGRLEGDRIKLAGVVSAFGGIPASEINKEHVITKIRDADNYMIAVTTAPTSAAAGGGSAVDLFEQIAAGNMDGATGLGYGMGKYGTGLYGVAKTSTGGTLSYYPRIWSFDSFGDDMVMCPGDVTAGDGQKIYIWGGDTDVAPQVILDAPTDCNWVFTYSNAVTALCDSRVDISKAGDATVWTPAVTNNAFSDDISRVVRFISGIRVGEYALLFTDDEVLLLQWVGEPDYYVIDDLQQSDGIIAPNACCTMEQVCYWQGKRGFYRFNRSGIERLANTQNEDWIIDNINQGQQFKSFAMADSKYNQLWFYFPTNANNEPSDYVIYNINQGHWTLGTQSRTGAMRNGFVGDKIYTIYSDSTSTPGSLYSHFLTANPSLTLSPYAETSYAMIGEGDSKFRINKIMPDTYQNGDITLKVVTKQYPQSTTESESSYTVTALQPYVTVRKSGRVRKYRIEQNSAGAYFTIGDWKEDIIRQGLR